MSTAIWHRTKILIVGLLLSASLFAYTNLAQADNGLLFGQSHFYTVIFRGNGEAITYAKIAITNPDDKPLSQFSFELSKVTPSEMVMYQMKLPPVCVRYNYNDPANSCVEYSEPDYTQQYYYGSSDRKTEYQKISYEKSGNIYSMTLPTPIEPQKSSAVIIAYSAKGYVNSNNGLYTFNFETLKVSTRIQSIRAVIDVDSDLLLKGKRSSVNYNSTGLSSDKLAAPSSISNRELDSVVSNIGSYGPLVKEAKNLAPNESFLVKGEYATNWFRLYLTSILITILIIIAILVGIYFLAKFWKKHGGKNERLESQTPKGQPAQSSTQESISFLNLTNASAGLISAILVVGLTYLLKFLSDSSIPYSSSIDPLVEIIGAITVVFLYILIIFGPAIIVASKHGWKALISILVAEFLWFIVFLFVYFLLFQSGLTASIFPGRPTILE